jgi:hypothetical protein
MPDDQIAQVLTQIRGDEVMGPLRGHASRLGLPGIVCHPLEPRHHVEEVDVALLVLVGERCHCHFIEKRRLFEFDVAQEKAQCQVGPSQRARQNFLVRVAYRDMLFDDVGLIVASHGGAIVGWSAFPRSIVDNLEVPEKRNSHRFLSFMMS